MTVIGIDDTDSRQRGMCTTYVAAQVACHLRSSGGSVDRILLVRLNPAVPHKTRGNGALAIHTDHTVGSSFRTARRIVDAAAETADPATQPGLVVSPDPPAGISAAVTDHARRALTEQLSLQDARESIEAEGYEWAGWNGGRGLVGALAAVGAWRAIDDWTYECITYRHPDRWGTERAVDRDSVFAAAEAWYPTVWDTVDRTEGTVVCVPRTPGPVLHGIRGDEPDAVRSASRTIESEPTAFRTTFVTNQGTDAHLRDGDLATVMDGRAYRVDGTVASGPETREGGHVFLTLTDGDHRLECTAFEPTKGFRDHVRSLREGDQVTACGEVTDGTLKLEKFAVRSLVRTEQAVPSCSVCRRTMESLGRGRGYRCRDCGTRASGRVERPIERDLTIGWYEVPPRARRHVARPLIRGGFDAPTNPER